MSAVSAAALQSIACWLERRATGFDALVTSEDPSDRYMLKAQALRDAAEALRAPELELEEAPDPVGLFEVDGLPLDQAAACLQDWLEQVSAGQMRITRLIALTPEDGTVNVTLQLAPGAAHFGPTAEHCGWLRITQRPSRDQTEIEGTTYANELLRTLGQGGTDRGPFVIESRADVVVTLRSVERWPESAEVPAAAPSAPDSPAFELVSGFVREIRDASLSGSLIEAANRALAALNELRSTQAPPPLSRVPMSGHHIVVNAVDAAEWDATSTLTVSGRLSALLLHTVAVVLAERRAQRAGTGDADRDVAPQPAGALAMAAAGYALSAAIAFGGSILIMPQQVLLEPRQLCPWPQGLHPGTPGRQLVRAAALILGELERRAGSPL